MEQLNRRIKAAIGAHGNGRQQRKRKQKLYDAIEERDFTLYDYQTEDDFNFSDKTNKREKVK